MQPNETAPFKGAQPGPAPALNWPAGQAIPGFPTPADQLVAVDRSSLRNPDIALAFYSLQGLVNVVKPRILMVEGGGEVGKFAWAETLKLNWSLFDGDIVNLFAQFREHVHGFVFYDPAKNEHYRNAAQTIANVYRYIPVAVALRDRIPSGVAHTANTIDITAWPETKTVDIYKRLYTEVWPYCSKRLILSADPRVHDLSRDIAAAAGAAVVWLDNCDADERHCYHKFVKDMAENPETALAMGWYTTERSGICAASTYGVGTVPADYYSNGTVYGGATGNADNNDRTIHYPAVPPRAKLENKPYVAVFMTDGDNIQYCQRGMRDVWDAAEEVENRGKININWTISPMLPDIGPGIMNYIYGLASDKECFVSGPSGAGYLMPTNTLREPGAPVQDFLTDRKYMDDFTRLTETYLQKSGLRAITIWDDAVPAMRESYEQNCPHLYGATVQNFRDGIVHESVEGDRLYFVKHQTHYEGMRETIYRAMKDQLKKWDKKSPLFLSYQIKIWKNDDGSYTRTPQLLDIHNRLKKEFPAMEWVRADHFFNLHNEAKGLPYNLCMCDDVKVTTSQGDGRLAIDGTRATAWEAKAGDWIRITFAKPVVVQYATVNGRCGSEYENLAMEIAPDGMSATVTAKADFLLEELEVYGK